MAKRVKVVVVDDNVKKDNITYKRKVIFSIVSLATLEINGVERIGRNYHSPIKSLVKKGNKKGIIIDFDKNGKVNISVYVVMKFGYSVRDIAFRVQENIKSSVESMTEFKVGQINVGVVGVVFSENDNDFIA